jgi:hypothetical protein
MGITTKTPLGFDESTNRRWEKPSLHHGEMKPKKKIQEIQHLPLDRAQITRD